MNTIGLSDNNREGVVVVSSMSREERIGSKDKKKKGGMNGEKEENWKRITKMRCYFVMTRSDTYCSSVLMKSTDFLSKEVVFVLK